MTAGYMMGAKYPYSLRLLQLAASRDVGQSQRAHTVRDGSMLVVELDTSCSATGARTLAQCIGRQVSREICKTLLVQHVRSLRCKHPGTPQDRHSFQLSLLTS